VDGGRMKRTSNFYHLHTVKRRRAETKEEMGNETEENKQNYQQIFIYKNLFLLLVVKLEKIVLFE
jgi:phage terminase large subunit-like protein